MSIARWNGWVAPPSPATTRPTAHAWGATRALAREQGLTLYDAAYLELAIRKARPLASCDADLMAAAERRGVEVLTA